MDLGIVQAVNTQWLFVCIFDLRFTRGSTFFFLDHVFSDHFGRPKRSPETVGNEHQQHQVNGGPRGNPNSKSIYRKLSEMVENEERRYHHHQQTANNAMMVDHDSDDNANSNGACTDGGVSSSGVSTGNEAATTPSSTSPTSRASTSASSYSRTRVVHQRGSTVSRSSRINLAMMTYK